MSKQETTKNFQHDHILERSIQKALPTAYRPEGHPDWLLALQDLTDWIASLPGDSIDPDYLSQLQAWYCQFPHEQVISWLKLRQQMIELAPHLLHDPSNPWVGYGRGILTLLHAIHLYRSGAGTESITMALADLAEEIARIVVRLARKAQQTEKEKAAQQHRKWAAKGGQARAKSLQPLKIKAMEVWNEIERDPKQTRRFLNKTSISTEVAHRLHKEISECPLLKSDAHLERTLMKWRQEFLRDQDFRLGTTCHVKFDARTTLSDEKTAFERKSWGHMKT